MRTSSSPLGAAVVLAASTWLAGCSCNEQGFSFPPPAEQVVVESPESVGSWLSLDVAPDGARLTMAYYDRVRTALGYAVGTVAADETVTWAHEHVDGWPEANGLDTGDRGRYASQRTAPDGTVWVAYHDARTGALRVAHRTAPHDWGEPVVVDGGAGLPGAGAWASLALDAQGLPVVAHCAGATVRLSRFDGAAWSTTDLYASDGGVAYTDLAMVGGVAYVAFRDTATGDLHLAVDGEDTIVDAEGDVGAWPSVWTDGTQVRIAYQDLAAQDLLMASRTDPSDDWRIEVVDDGPMRGADTEMLELDGAPAILYFDGYDNDAWLAKLADGAWRLERIGAEGKAVGFHNEAVVASGRLWVGSYDFAADELFLKGL